MHIYYIHLQSLTIINLTLQQHHHFVVQLEGRCHVLETINDTFLPNNPTIGPNYLCLAHWTPALLLSHIGLHEHFECKQHPPDFTSMPIFDTGRSTFLENLIAHSSLDSTSYVSKTKLVHFSFCWLLKLSCAVQIPNLLQSTLLCATGAISVQCHLLPFLFNIRKASADFPHQNIFWRRSISLIVPGLNLMHVWPSWMGPISQ